MSSPMPSSLGVTGRQHASSSSNSSARSVDRWLILDEPVQGMSVGEAMERDLETISPQLTLDTFAAGLLDGTVTPALPVLRDDVLVGIVGLAQVRAVAPGNWPSTRT